VFQLITELFPESADAFDTLGEAFLTVVGKRRDPWAGAAIWRAAKKAISYQGPIWPLRFGFFPAKLFSLILGVLIFWLLYSEAT